MISRSFTIRKYIAWYDFKILCLEKVYCLVCFRDPLSWESILPGMLSGSFVIRKYIAWYEFRILFHKNVYPWVPDFVPDLVPDFVPDLVPDFVPDLWVSYNVFLHLLATFCKYDVPSSNDYASKNRLEILCKNPVRMPRYLFPRPDILAYFWNHRTLVRMSTKCTLKKLKEVESWAPERVPFFLNQTLLCLHCLGPQAPFFLN